MKSSIIILAISFFYFNVSAKTLPATLVVNKTGNIKVSNKTTNTKIGKAIIKTEPCTRTGTVQVAGVGCVDISVTAATCAEAEKGVAAAKKALQ